MTDRETEPLPAVSPLPERMIEDERDIRESVTRDEMGRTGSEEPALAAVAPVGVVEPETRQEAATTTPEPDERKTFDEPLNFFEPPPALQAPSMQMEYEKKDRGPKTKFYERIAMLERMRDGDTTDWDLLEPGMQRYYRREYLEYFGRDNKEKRTKREQNSIKAARIRHERLQREYRQRSSPVLS